MKRIAHEIQPAQAYVMPDEPKLTDEELDALSDEDYDRIFGRRNGVVIEYDGDPMEEARQSIDPDEDWDDEPSVATEIEKACHPIIEGALLQDARSEIAHIPDAGSFEANASIESVKMLTVGMAIKANSSMRPPKPEAIAAAATYAIAKAKRERNMQAPRDAAKVAGVRYQTFLGLVHDASLMIQSLGITGDLLGDTGTYNTSDGDIDSDLDAALSGPPNPRPPRSVSANGQKPGVDW